MSLKYIILGIINRKPVSGYEIKKIFDYSVRFYWPATHSQIYRTLDEIFNEDLAVREEIKPSGSPLKHIYTITKKGKDAFVDWLKTPQGMPVFRDPLLVQVSNGLLINDNDILAIINSRESDLLERKKAYESIDYVVIQKEAQSDREAFFWKMTLESGRMFIESELEWIFMFKKEFKKIN